MRWLLAIVAIAAASAGTWALVGNPFEPPLYRVCEGELKERLVAPAGYKRVAIADVREKMSREDFVKMLRDTKEVKTLSEHLLERYDSGASFPTTFALAITYDAPNAFGTPLRQLATCEYFSKYGDASRASGLDVRVNGRTHMEHLVDRVVDAQGPGFATRNVNR